MRSRQKVVILRTATGTEEYRAALIDDTLCVGHGSDGSDGGWSLSVRLDSRGRATTGEIVLEGDSVVRIPVRFVPESDPVEDSRRVTLDGIERVGTWYIDK